MALPQDRTSSVQNGASVQEHNKYTLTFTTVTKSKCSKMLTLATVVHFRCQLHWIKGYPRNWQSIIAGHVCKCVSGRAWHLNQWIKGKSTLTQCGWAPSWIEQKGREKVISFSLSLSFLELGHFSSLALGHHRSRFSGLWLRD